ncbi:MAG: MAPEG family protein [Thiohalophilus sp.]|uniref:MAPEG family protein n=1 Tax=Thiohalophilus sp. TaxID=3028392 RepID=UPI002870804E|nr:MAPEG family protein [Thiohalophilus sp.]MDR9437813.1 MAPEG family protein [Thiohalophilus sp.]
MNQAAIFIPFSGMLLLTMVVWLYMYYRRLSYLARAGVDPQQASTSQQLLAILPTRINLPSENLTNLFELPVLFYVVCLYLYVTGQVDPTYLVLGYAFFVFRLLHSVIHCTYNRVLHRFYAYSFASLALWAMIILAVIDTIRL